MSKPWQTKDWQTKRTKLIKNRSCEWCGTLNDLSIHHKKQIVDAEKHKKMVTSKFLKKAIEKEEFKTKVKYIPTCPKCRTHRKSDIKERKRTKPQHKHLKRFRCVNCGHEYEKTIYRRQKTNRLSKSDWDKFLIKYKNEINQMVKNQRLELHLRYMSLKDTQILCKRCHFAFHNGMKLCSVCKERYHEKKWSMCFICFNKK